MFNLIIIGAGPFGREVYYWIKEGKTNVNASSISFLDNRPNILNEYGLKETVLSDFENYEPYSNDLFICAIGDPKVKKTAYDTLKNKGANFISIVHKSVIISSNTIIGECCIIAPNVVISNNVTIADNVSINTGSSIGHDCNIASHVHINVHANITGYVTIEEQVLVQGSSCVTPGLTIGQCSTIGVGSVVLKNVEPNSSMFGNPARKFA